MDSKNIEVDTRWYMLGSSDQCGVDFYGQFELKSFTISQETNSSSSFSASFKRDVHI